MLTGPVSISIRPLKPPDCFRSPGASTQWNHLPIRDCNRAWKPAQVTIVGRCSARKGTLVVNVGARRTRVNESIESEGLAELMTSAGSPLPYGAIFRENGVNFSIYSSGASRATLCLFTLSDLKEKRASKEIQLDPLVNKTGDIWHVFVTGDLKDTLYGYKFDGKFMPLAGHYFDYSRILLDPYAKVAVSRGEYGVLDPDENCWSKMGGMVPFQEGEFDWEGDLPLHIPQKDIIIYEMHVRGFTRHDSSKTINPGTYLGIIEKLDHLKV